MLEPSFSQHEMNGEFVSNLLTSASGGGATVDTRTTVLASAVLPGGGVSVVPVGLGTSTGLGLSVELGGGTSLVVSAAV
jgi:sporulation-control protein spo0M